MPTNFSRCAVRPRPSGPQGVPVDVQRVNELGQLACDKKVELVGDPEVTFG
jgi:hypothetical protein